MKSADTGTIRKVNDEWYEKQRKRKAYAKQGVALPAKTPKKRGPKSKKKKKWNFNKPKEQQAAVAVAQEARRSSLRSSGISPACNDEQSTNEVTPLQALQSPVPAAASRLASRSARTTTGRFSSQPTARVTRAQAQAVSTNTRNQPSRNRGPPEMFSKIIFPPSRPTTCPADHYKKTLERERNRADMANVASRQFKKMWMKSLCDLESTRTELDKMRRELQALRESTDEVIDRPILNPSSLEVPPVTNAEIKSGVKACLSAGSTITPQQTAAIFTALGLEGKGQVSNVEAKKKIIQAVQRVFGYHFPNYDEAERADILGECLFNGDLFGKESAINVATEVTRSITTAVWSTVRLLKDIDTSGGSMNDSCISQIARMEKTSGLTNGKKGRYMMHNRRKITHVRNIANRFVKHLLNVQHDPNNAAGPKVWIDPARALRVSIEALGLKDKAMEEGIQWAVAGDAAQVTTSTDTDQCCVGGKHTDEDAVNPRCPNEKMFTQIVLDEDGNWVTEYRNYQSTDICMPCTIVEAKEGAAVKQDCFDDFYSFVKMLESEGLPADGNEPAFKPFTIISCGDMSYLQKMCGAGGACKVKKLFCHYCPCHGDYDMFYVCYDEDRCWICVHNESEECTHMAVLDREQIAANEQTLQALLVADFEQRTSETSELSLRDTLPALSDCYSGVDDKGKKILSKLCLKDAFDEDSNPLHPHLYDYLRDIQHTEETESVKKATQVHLHPNRFNKTAEIDHIDYDYKNGKPVQNSQFHARVYESLAARGYDLSALPSDKDVRVNLLRSRLLLAEDISRLRQSLVQHEDALHSRRFDPGQCPPCVLHAHCRIVEKILQQLLLFGMRLNMDGRQKLDAFIAAVEEVMRKDILQRKTSSTTSSWQFPLTSDRKLDDITLSNTKARKIAKGLHKLVDICVTGDENIAHRRSWHEICKKFLVVAEWFDSKKQFNMEDVCAFQKDADEFCRVYFGQTGRDGMTNYIHAIRSGHLAYFLDKYKNLYRLSQQGWENVNSRLKRSYHHNTAKGGGKGGSSKLLPVLYNLSREMLWKFGYLDGLFQHIGHDGKITLQYRKIERMPTINDAPDEEVKKYADLILTCAADMEPFAETEVELTAVDEGGDSDVESSSSDEEQDEEQIEEQGEEQTEEQIEEEIEEGLC